MTLITPQTNPNDTLVYSKNDCVKCKQTKKIMDMKHVPYVEINIQESEYFDEYIHGDFSKNRRSAMALLQEESGLQEIVRLVGQDSLSPQDQLKLFTAKSLREDFLQQNAFDDVDTYCSQEKQYRMLEGILAFHNLAKDALEKGVYLREIQNMEIRADVVRMRLIPEDQLSKFDEIMENMKKEFAKMISEREEQHA